LLREVEGVDGVEKVINVSTLGLASGDKSAKLTVHNKSISTDNRTISLNYTEHNSEGVNVPGLSAGQTYVFVVKRITSAGVLNTERAEALIYDNLQDIVSLSIANVVQVSDGSSNIDFKVAPGASNGQEYDTLHYTYSHYDCPTI
jgi:hypothetical protein